MILSKTEAKTAAHQFSKFRRQIEHAGKNGKMAPVCPNLILRHIKLQENDFYSLTGLQISFHIM